MKSVGDGSFKDPRVGGGAVVRPSSGVTTTEGSAKRKTGVLAIDAQAPAPLQGQLVTPTGEPLGASKTVHARAGASLKEANPWLTFSEAPDKLTERLVGEIQAAMDFAGSLRNAITFFGGARVETTSPFFEQGKKWGEAILLSDVAAERPEIVVHAAASGLFSAESVSAASAVALGVAAGDAGPMPLAQQLAALGGLCNKDALAAALAKVEGERLAPADPKMLELLTKTGAGPGMMEAVPLGYHEARQDLQQLIAVPPDLAAKLETQGSRIKLPFEQETTPYIQKLQQFAHFLPRRLALTESSAAFVVFPGGFGTLNEMFEVMRLGRPTLMDSRPFWSGMLDVLKTKWKERDLVEPKVLENMLLVDGVTEGLPKLMAAAAKAGAAKPPSLERAGEMTGDIQRGIATLSKLPSAVTFIGGSRLRSSDMEVGVAKDLASRLAKSGIHSRAGGDGAVLDAVSQGVRAARKDMEVQALLHDRGDLDAKKVKDKAEVFEVVRSEAVHKLLMYENTDAIVALPGGVGVFDEVWEVACLMQTGKLPKRPLVLVGKDFWQPFLDEVEKAMWQGKTKMIADGDMKLFTVVDDAAQASQLIRKHRAQREVEVQGA